MYIGAMPLLWPASCSGPLHVRHVASYSQLQPAVMCELASMDLSAALSLMQHRADWALTLSLAHEVGCCDRLGGVSFAGM
jgi:hypothetical protein